MNASSRGAARHGLALAAALALPLLSWQLSTRVWSFPEPAPFRGPSLYNPYRGALFAPGDLRRSNFHAHTRSWAGLTDGRRVTAEELRSGYRRLGYDVAQISDYMSIRPSGEGPGPWIPTYEHGYGATKTHHLCIGASRVDWLEFPLFQTIHHKQTVIDSLRKSVRIVAVVHPHHWGYSLDDLRQLSGYALLEVASVLPGDATLFWDAALSSGHPVFALASDDSHGLEGGRGAGVCATFVDAPAADGEAIVASLAAGRAYAAKVDQEAGGTLAAKAARLRDLPRLSRFSVDGETIRVALSGPARTIRFVGQGGRELSRAVDAKEAAYRIVAEDTYVRTEIHFSGQTRLYLNPVFRYDGPDPLRGPESREIGLLSGLLRAAAALPWIALAGMLVRVRRRP